MPTLFNCSSFKEPNTVPIPALHMRAEFHLSTSSVASDWIFFLEFFPIPSSRDSTYGSLCISAADDLHQGSDHVPTTGVAKLIATYPVDVHKLASQQKNSSRST